MRPNWNGVLQSLVLVRLGQELGTVSPAAQVVHDLIGLLLTFSSGFLGR
jgi:hypothetical protein